MYFEYKLRGGQRGNYLIRRNLKAIAFFILFFVFMTGLPSGRLVLPVNAVTVGPAKLELSVDPGEVVKGEFFLQNDEKVARKFVAVFEGFTEEGVEKVFFSDTSDLASWFKTRDDIVLGPGEFQNVPFTLTVPKDAAPGGHFAVIWWGTASPESKQVSIVTRAGILVYLRVSGEVNESAELLKFAAEGGFFQTKMPENFVISFKNSG